jgi:ParB-like chromosome segregation protein Spo0J
MGDITALARSIKKHGLLHPIVIDDQKNLVAGGRRLAACEQLGWEKIPVTRLEELTEAQRREIELEENLQRKDLTAYERSLTVVQLRQAAKEAAAEEEEFRTDSVRNSGRGRKPRAGSERTVAKRTGIAASTARDAEAHVALAQQYPQLQDPAWKQSHVMALAETMAPMPKKDRDLAMELVNGGTNDFKIVMDVVKNVAAMPAAERKEIATLWASDDSRDQKKAQTLAAKKPAMPDPRLSILKEAIALINKAIKAFPTDDEADLLRLEVDHLTRIREAIKAA